MKLFKHNKIAILFFVVAWVLTLERLCAAEQAVQQQLEGFNLSGYTDSGDKAWDINGDTADISDQNIKITNVNANSYGKQNANLTAKTGNINKVTGDIQLNKDVVTTSNDRGTQLLTESLEWKRNEDLVSTNDPVKIKDKDMTITGTGITAHPNLKTAAINEDVTANVKTVTATGSGTGSSLTSASGQTVLITCDGPLELDQFRQSAVFNKNVVAIEKSTGRELRADKVEVYFDQKNSKIKRLLCTGNVSIKQGNNMTFADQLNYDALDQKMTLTGRPRLIMDVGDSQNNPFKGLDKKKE